MIITINGHIGSGKSTIGRALAKRLSLPYYSTGNILRETATKRGLTIYELMDAAKHDPSIDHDIDSYQTNLPAQIPSFVIEGRLGWYFIPHAVKIFLNVDPEEATKRIFLAQQNGERSTEATYQTQEDVRTAIQRRLACDRERYQTLYQVDPFDPKHYDLVIDTTHKSPIQIEGEIIDKLHALGYAVAT